MKPATLSYFISPRHCVYEVSELERPGVEQNPNTSACDLQRLSDEAIFLRQLKIESLSTPQAKPRHYVLRARRLLRRLSNSQRSLLQGQLKLRLAMTKGER